MKVKLIILTVGLMTLVSCNRYVAPPFTDVDKISQIKTGMKLRQISDVLGIEPYDVFYIQETGASLYSFNYRLKNRIMYIYNTVNKTEVGRQTSDENSQKSGDVYYDKKYRTLYVMFSPTGEMLSYLTSSGVEDKGKLVVIGNSIKFYDEKNTTLVDSTYNKAFNPNYNSRPIHIDFKGSDANNPGFFKRILNSNK